MSAIATKLFCASAEHNSHNMMVCEMEDNYFGKCALVRSYHPGFLFQIMTNLLRGTDLLMLTIFFCFLPDLSSFFAYKTEYFLLLKFRFM